MLTQPDLLALFNAVETSRPDQAPFPIVGPITTEHRGQTRFYRVPIRVPDLAGTPETLIVTVRPIHASNEFPGTLLGEPITTGSRVLFNLVAVQEGEDEPTTAPAVTSADPATAPLPAMTPSPAIASTPEATTPEAVTTPAQAA